MPLDVSRCTRLPPVEPAPTPSLVRLASAQEPELPDGSPWSRLSELEARLQQLEAQQQQDAADTSPQAGDAAAESRRVVVGSDKAMTAYWDNGLKLETKAKDFQVKVGGRTQFDNSYFSNDPRLTVSPTIGGIGPEPDSFQFRRGRLRLEGKMYENFDWVAEYDFVFTLAPAAPNSGQPVIAVPGVTDLWGNLTDLPRIGNVRFGNMKEPLGMEHLTSSRFLPFIERSFLQDVIFGPFNNGFTPGVMMLNTMDQDLGTWALGWFSAQNSIFGYGIGPESAVSGRVTRLLVYDEPAEGRYLVHLGISGSIRGPDEGQVRLRARGNIRSGPPGVLNPIYVDTEPMAATLEQFGTVEFAANAGPLTVQAEYAAIVVNNAVQPYQPPGPIVDRGSPFFHGGYVQLLWFLTGEHTPYNRRYGVFDRIVPNENFFVVSGGPGQCCGRGAWQLGFRYDAMDLNDNGINGGIVHGFTWGLNWYWNPNMKVQFNYDLTHRSRVDEVPPGFINGFGLRYAMDF